MLNLLRMDFRRIFKSKSFYVCLAIQIFMTAATIGLLYMMINPEVLAPLREAVVNTEEQEQSVQDILKFSQVEIYNSIGFSGGAFYIIITILNVLYVCSDFDSGFVKNIFSLHTKREKYLAGKWISMQTVSTIYMLAMLAVMFIIINILGIEFQASALSEVVKALFVFWVISGASIAQSIFICILFRSKSVGVAASLLLQSGLAITIIDGILGMIGISLPIWDYTLYGSLSEFPYPASMQEVLFCTAVGVGWFAVWSILSVIVLRKRDI